MQQIFRHYGYDLLMFTFDEGGYTEPGYVSLQVKASATLETSGPDYVFGYSRLRALDDRAIPGHSDFV